MRLLRPHTKNSKFLLIELVKRAAEDYSHPPVSKFRVGASALGKSGAIYLGANLEFLGANLAQSVHAEQFTVALMAARGEVGLHSLAITHAPCGHCRQFFQEVYGASGMRVVFPGSPAAVLSDLLPAAFTPEDLHGDDPPLVMKGVAFDLVPTARQSIDADADPVAAAALDAARNCHAPYTNCPSGVALRFDDGSIFAGAYYECAAYNPSLPPMQAAIVAAVADGVAIPDERDEPSGRWLRIVDAVLCEIADAPVSQRSPTETVLRSLVEHGPQAPAGDDGVMLRVIDVAIR